MHGMTDVLGSPIVAHDASGVPSHSSLHPRRVRRGVIGIVHRDDRYLFIQRASGVAVPGRWCFPGGHVEPGEAPRRAIIREMREELGMETEPVHRLGSVRGRADVILAIWMVRDVDGVIAPNPREIAAVAWVTTNEIRAHPLGLPSNLPVADMLDAWRLRSCGRDDPRPRR